MTHRLLRSALVAAAFSSFAVGASANAAAGDSLKVYQAAWTDPLSVDLGRILPQGAEYYDADWNRSIDTSDFEAYRQSLSHLTFTLVTETQTGAEVTLVWSVSDAHQRWESVDTVTLSQGTIASVISSGREAGPSEKAWIDRFIAARRSLDGPSFRQFMDPNARIVGSSLQESSSTVDGFIAFMGTLRGTVYERLPGETIFRGKDGHFYYEFQVLLSSGMPVVSGRDHVVVVNGKIMRFEGVY